MVSRFICKTCGGGRIINFFAYAPLVMTFGEQGTAFIMMIIVQVHLRPLKGQLNLIFFYLYSRRINVAIKGYDFVILIRYKFLCHHDGNIVDHVELLFFRSLDSSVIFSDFTN